MLRKNTTIPILSGIALSTLLLSACSSGSSSSGPAGDGNDADITIELVSANAIGDSAQGAQMVGANHASLSGAGAGGAMDTSGELITFHGGGIDYNAATGYMEVFVRDMDATDLDVEHVSLGPDDEEHSAFAGYSLRPVLSGDGNTVAFYSTGFSNVDAIHAQIYVRDLNAEQTVVASVIHNSGNPGDAGSRFPNLDNAGKLVVFESEADLLNGGTHDNEPGMPFPAQQIYLRDLENDETVLISRDATDDSEPGTGRSEYADISGNGEYVVFESRAGNLLQDVDGDHHSVFIYTVDDGTLAHISVDVQGDALETDASRPAISDDGERVVFRTSSALYLWKRGQGTEKVLNGSITDPALSGNGRYVAFQDTEPNNGQIYRLDLDSDDDPIRISHAHDGSTPDEDCEHPVISEDGSIIAFDSSATNLIGGSHDHGDSSDTYRAVIDNS